MIDAPNEHAARARLLLQIAQGAMQEALWHLRRCDGLYDMQQRIMDEAEWRLSKVVGDLPR